MKKMLLIAAFFTAITLTASAQTTRFGRINASEIIMLMPETESAQTEIDAYEKELTSQINTMQDEYGKKVREYQEKNSTMTPLVRQQMEKDIMDLQAKIENFAQAAQRDAQDAAMRLMTPVREKVLNAINQVAKSNSLTAVIDLSQPPFIYIDESSIFDMTAEVKKVLNIEGRKIPASLQPTMQQPVQ